MKLEKLNAQQIEQLKARMRRLAERNSSWNIKPDNFEELFPYLVAQKITYLYDDELFEKLVFVDTKKTGKSEELLDAYLILDQGEELHLKLFQFKYAKNFDKGISTKELYAFVDRMNRVFLRGDLEDPKTLEAFAEVRTAFDKARKLFPRAKPRIHCYYAVNGQNVSSTDRKKVDEIREIYRTDRQTYGFMFETYGGLDIYNLCEQGRVPIQDETIELDYDLGPSQILHQNIGPNPNGMPIQVMVGFVNVNQLIRLVGRYSNNELFEKNVRFFLGAGKEVNRRIIETVTSNQSSWFGFMNNGVSITADKMEAAMPPSGKRLKVTLTNMQIINGCQTVNALYHAKHDPELKDKFQGNSNVLVRIYQIDPKNKAFLEALIIATNSQNAIRAEDLLANDPTQIQLQKLLLEYGVGYERKEGESLPESHYRSVFSKEDAALAYLAVFDAKAAVLRGSLSRRKFFRQGDEYNVVFNLRDEPPTPDGELPLAPATNSATPSVAACKRGLQFVTAHLLDEGCRNKIAAIADLKKRASLRKAAFYLDHLVYLLNKPALDKAVEEGAKKQPDAKIIDGLKLKVTAALNSSFDTAAKSFEKSLADYLKGKGSDEDAALKNMQFAEKAFQLPKLPGE